MEAYQGAAAEYKDSLGGIVRFILMSTELIALSTDVSQSR